MASLLDKLRAQAGPGASAPGPDAKVGNSLAQQLQNMYGMPTSTPAPQKTFYDQWKEQVEAKEAEYQKDAKASGFGARVKGFFGSLGQAFDNQLQYAEENPYLGYDVYSGSGMDVSYETTPRSTPTLQEMLQSDSARINVAAANRDKEYAELRYLQGQGSYYALLTDMQAAGYNQVGAYIKHLE